MATEATQIPGGPAVIETETAPAQIPGAQFIYETGAPDPAVVSRFYMAT
jgi:hypothetical protein